MAKRGTASADYDSPWKVALHKYLQWFLAFFFPPIDTDIDWTRGYEALDKEFQQIIRRAQVGKQVADMLFKVWLKDGSECWLFIHIEIQGSYGKRVLAANVRLQHVVSGRQAARLRPRFRVVGEK
jgi:hypothetical protein